MERKLLFIALFFAVFFAGCSTEDVNNFTSKPVNVEKPDTTIPNDENDDPIVIVDPIIENIVVAHRGAWKKNKLPHNSIASLKEAIRLKCKGSEFDICISADDSLIVSHDPYYNNLLISTSKYSELATLKLSNGEILPTLRDYVKTTKSNTSTTLLYCELKTDKLPAARKKVFVEKTNKLIKELEAENIITISSFDYYILKLMREANPLIDLQYLNGDVSPEQLKSDKITGACYNISVFKNHNDWIESARLNNISLSVWTLNDSESIKWAMNNKFNALVTDEPELAIDLAKQ
ncbi:glycerophosphoryl diester phosphodiesterase [Flavobacterium resistens]|uniref:Glycerophosphodiester phosphodiesterase n=1 Tax=Flavobacterium resistens TaxID=443612 RepID=A0A521DUD2_9FLAO|nr:glycerophosphodiester phosphodiesterase family protein [Flavobacterium resistens]MRX68162.1 glycerophosphodiester phosphodiesterase [Flavobacterium resistens]SMO75255.1 glycerophosphoryl diester phosphodiesterase [Flavobacterium resistens]